MPVEVIDTIKPANGNTFPVADVVDLKGVDQNFADIAERDAFDAEKLVVGQRARTRADSKTWEVTSLSPVVWTEVVAGGAVTSVAGRTGDVVLTHDDVGGVLSGVLLGRHAAGSGAAQHISLASTFILQGSTLTIADASIGTSKLGGDITAAGKALLDDVDAAAQRATMGAEVAGAASTAVSAHAALTTAHGESAFGATLKTSSGAPAARSTLGLPASATRTITHSSSPPSGGVAGDIHFQIP